MEKIMAKVCSEKIDFDRSWFGFTDQTPSLKPYITSILP